MAATKRQSPKYLSELERTRIVKDYVAQFLTRMEMNAVEGKRSCLIQYKIGKLESSKKNAKYWENCASCCEWLTRIWQQGNHRELAERMSQCRAENSPVQER